MITEKSIMTTEAIFSDDRQYRYLLKKEWDAKKPQATIIMTNPSTADLITMDYTTLYIQNNLLKLNFGGVDIVNLISKTTTKLNIPKDVELEEDIENIDYITESAKNADNIIIAWGKLGENNSKIRKLQESLLEKLRPYQDKLYMIADNKGEVGFHPLAPQIRFEWILKRYEIPSKKTEATDATPKKRSKNKKSQTGHEELPVQEAPPAESA